MNNTGTKPVRETEEKKNENSISNFHKMTEKIEVNDLMETDLAPANL